MYRRFCRLLLLAFIGSVLLSSTAFAHAVLTESAPGPGSRLNEAPAEIKLRFQEAVESSLWTLRVLDADGKQAASDKQAALSADRRTLSLALPQLQDGIYTVTYKVVSADGHPVGGSYVFSVGAVSPGAADQFRSALPQEAVSSSEQPLAAAIRTLYFFSLMSLAGWLFWQGDAAWRWQLYTLFAAALAAHGVWQLTHAADDWSAKTLVAFLTGSAGGMVWSVTLVLGLIGPLLWRLPIPAVHRLWAGSLLAVNGFSGHAAAHGAYGAAALFMVFHLIAGAVWVGGLLYLVRLWRRTNAAALELLPRFSRAALASIAALVLSGSLCALLLLPHPQYVVYGAWGRWLLLKIGVVLLVMVTAGWIRKRMRQGSARRIGPLLAADFTLMLLIVIISGIFTGFSPLPANRPLLWEETSGALQAAVDITPNTPGRNHVHVSVTLPAPLGPPKRVELSLRNLDQSDLYPIDIPLTPLTPAVPGQAGIDQQAQRFEYMTEGEFLPFPGRWQTELRVTDRNDDETVLRKDMRVF